MAWKAKNYVITRINADKIEKISDVINNFDIKDEFISYAVWYEIQIKKHFYPDEMIKSSKDMTLKIIFIYLLAIGRLVVEDADRMTIINKLAKSIRNDTSNILFKTIKKSIDVLPRDKGILKKSRYDFIRSAAFKEISIETLKTVKFKANIDINKKLNLDDEYMKHLQDKLDKSNMDKIVTDILNKHKFKGVKELSKWYIASLKKLVKQPNASLRRILRFIYPGQYILQYGHNNIAAVKTHYGIIGADALNKTIELDTQEWNDELQAMDSYSVNNDEDIDMDEQQYWEDNNDNNKENNENINPDFTHNITNIESNKSNDDNSMNMNTDPEVNGVNERKRDILNTAGLDDNEFSDDSMMNNIFRNNNNNQYKRLIEDVSNVIMRKFKKPRYNESYNNNNNNNINNDGLNKLNEEIYLKKVKELEQKHSKIMKEMDNTGNFSKKIYNKLLTYKNVDDRDFSREIKYVDITVSKDCVIKYMCSEDENKDDDISNIVNMPKKDKKLVDALIRSLVT